MPFSSDPHLTKIEVKLNDISEKCKGHSASFFNKSKTYSIVNTVLNVINISFTTITGILSTYSATTTENRLEIYNYISSVMLYTSACINSVQQFLNLESLSEKRKTTAMRFLALSNNIIKYLYTDTNMDKREYIKWVLNEYETILSHESLVENATLVAMATNPEYDTLMTSSDEIPDQPHYQYEIDRFAVSTYSTT